MIQVKDVQTNALFNVTMDDTVVVRTPDGVKVRLHPVFIKLTVKVKERFDAHTRLGMRQMVRVK